ncbi:hypothetical protein S7711_11606, partial [Stachybotrys chartarum IBT 7711]
MLIRSLI